MNTKQYIIVRQDCPTINGEPISPQKLAVQVSHASMAFLSKIILDNLKNGISTLAVDNDLLEWFHGSYTKVILRAKNLNDMRKIIDKAKNNNLQENKDFFCIHDLCKTELLPDDGQATCFTAIGFRPMESNLLLPIVKRLQLYR